MPIDPGADFDEAVADVAMIARQVLQLPLGTVTTQSPPEPVDRRGLVIGLVVAVLAVVLLLFTVAAAIVLWCRFHWTKK